MNNKNQFLKFPKLLTNVRTTFGHWLNNWLASSIAATPKSTEDIRVETTADGSYLFLNKNFQNNSNLEYLYDSEQKNIDGYESKADRQTRINNLISASGSDAPLYDINKEYKTGQIVRILSATTAFSASTYTEINWSSSLIYSDLTSGTYVLKPGTYVAVTNIPPSSSQQFYETYKNRIDGLKYFARNPKVIYWPIFPSEPKLNATFFTSGSNGTISGSTFEEYQGRFWECIGLFATGSSSGTGMIFRGQWSTTSTYKAQNVVIYSTGITGSNAGSYIANTDINSTGSSVAPFIGSPNWSLLGTLNTIGSWS
jgi:hypothetical protein